MQKKEWKDLAYLLAGWWIKVSSCWNAVPVITLPKNMLTKINRKYFDAVLLSNPEIDMWPSILLMIIRNVGSSIRKIFNTIPGKKPCITDFKEFLQDIALIIKIISRNAISFVLIKVELSITCTNQGLQHWENKTCSLPKKWHNMSTHFISCSNWLFFEVIDFHVVFNIVQCSNSEERSILWNTTLRGI